MNNHDSRSRRIISSFIIGLTADKNAKEVLKGVVVKTWRTLIGICGSIFVLTTLGLAQSQEQSQTKTITVCALRIADAGRAVSFRFNFLYSLEVNAGGKVSKVTELSNVQRAKKFKFVHDELFVECMNSWQIEPAGTYYVSFYVGTTSIGTEKGLPFNYMRIMYPNKRALIVELPDDSNDVLKIQEPKKGQ